MIVKQARSKLARVGHGLFPRAVVMMVLMGTAAPVLAQSTTSADPDTRLRRVEAEVRALQRQVFPGSDGKFFTPEVAAGSTVTTTPSGSPASTPVTDLLSRMESVEAQIARLTAQNEETANRVALLEGRLAAIAPVSASATSPAASVATTTPVAVAPATAAVTTPPAAVAATAKPSAAAPAKPVATKPTAQRVAAVKKIEKPQTGDAGDDEYSYGYRLWDAKLYPEAQQQLRLFVDKYPRHAKVSYGRNLLGKAFLDDGKPRDAAPWFLQNYQNDKKAPRAPDSLLNLAEAMRQLKDTNRACIALAEFGETYPRDAATRLKAQYDATKSATKCD